MNVQQIYKIASTTLWAVIVMVIVLLALYVSMGRYYLPLLGQYQEKIVTDIRMRTGVDLTIDNLEGTWHQLSPGIELSSIDIPSFADKNKPGLRADELKASINFFSSLIAMTPLLDNLTIKNPDIHVYELEPSQWSVAGIPSSGETSSQGFIQDLFDAVSFIEIDQADIYFYPLSGVNWSMGSIDIEMRQGVGVRQAKVLIKDIANKTVLEIDSESKGRWGDKKFEIKAHGKMSELELVPLLSLFGVTNIGASGLNGDFWFNWNSSSGATLQGDIATNNIRLSTSELNNATKIDNISVSYLVDVDLAANVKAWVSDASVEWKAEAYQFADLVFSRSENNDFYVALEHISVAPWLKLVNRVGKLPKKLASVLADIAPKGKLENIHVNLAGGVSISEGLQYSAGLDQLSSLSWSGAPGVENLSGYLSGSALSGQVDIDSENLSLSFPGIYQNVISIKHLLGAVAWNVDESVVVNSGPLAISGDFGNGHAQLDLTIPLQKTDEVFPLMSLIIGMSDFDVQYRNQVIPEVVGASLIDWLDQSILAGKGSEVGFIYYGSLLKQDSQRQVVQVEIDAVDAVIKYDPAWPAAENVKAKVVVSNGDTRGYVGSASIYNSELKNIDVLVLPRAKAIELKVSGDITGPATDVLKLFADTPLRESIGSAFDVWGVAGQYSADLSLSMSLVKGALPKVVVNGQLENVDLFSDSINLKFTRLNGDISYDSDTGLSASALNGELWGKPLTAAINTDNENGALTTAINVNGLVDMASVESWLNQPALGFAQGVSVMDARLLLASADNGGVQLLVDSLLEGVTIDLPLPFKKPAAAKLPLHLTARLDEPSLPVDLTLGDKASMSLLSSPLTGGFKGAIVVGDEVSDIGLPDTGLVFTGLIEKVLLDDWLRVIDQYQKFEQRGSTKANSGAGGAASSVAIENLQVGMLDAFGQKISGVEVGLFLDGERWVAEIKHERLKGRAWLPSEQHELKLDLDFIHLPLIAPVVVEKEVEEVVEENSDALADIDPRQYLAMSVQSRSTIINDVDLGSWRFHFKPSDKGAVISGIKADVSGMRVSGFDDEQGADLFWAVGNSASVSEFSGILSIDDVGDIFETQGLEPAVVSESARFIANVAWKGSPAAVSLASFNGDIQIDMRDGQLLQTSGTAAGALKLLGVLNFNNLVRRLQLDFSDLYKKGLSYNSVDGILMFNEGILTIDEPLHVKGPSSDFKMVGSLDLEQQTIDGELVITLPITSNLPWIVAVAGGLSVAVAAGTYLASLLFEDQLDKLSSAVYDISGTWSEPIIEFKRLFDLKPVAK